MGWKNKESYLNRRSGVSNIFKPSVFLTDFSLFQFISMKINLHLWTRIQREFWKPSLLWNARKPDENEEKNLKWWMICIQFQVDFYRNELRTMAAWGKEKKSVWRKIFFLNYKKEWKVPVEQSKGFLISQPLSPFHKQRERIMLQSVNVVWARG